MSLSRTSRADVFGLSREISSDEALFDYGGAMDFEFIDVDVEKGSRETSTLKRDGNHEDIDIDTVKEAENSQDEEYDFPLFAAVSNSHPLCSDKITSGVDAASDEVNNDNSKLLGRGRGTTKTMRISLREASEERIVNERDPSYYFAQYDQHKRDQFQISAVTFDDIWQWSLQRFDTKPWKVLDANKHNLAIEKETARDIEVQRKRRSRGGVVKRTQRIQTRERVKARKAMEKAVAKAKEEKLMKKRNHKRGGKKHKKKASATISKSKK